MVLSFCFGVIFHLFFESKYISSDKDWQYGIGCVLTVHQWLQSVVPTVSIRVYPCSSVVAICASIGVYPCLSVFICGCNLWFQRFPSVFIRVHRWLQSVVPLLSFLVSQCSSVVAICGFFCVFPCFFVFIGGFNLWFQWFSSVFVRFYLWLQSVVPFCVYPCLSVSICGCNLWFQLSTHHSFDLYPWGTKVDQQSQIQFGRLQVIQQLRLMYFIEG